MGEWQPIETAPKDGTRILISNGKLFTAACWQIEMEHFETWDWSQEAKKNGTWGKAFPNPKFGQVKYQLWSKDNPVAFLSEDQDSPDYDGCFETWDPTHWMPLLEAPH